MGRPSFKDLDYEICFYEGVLAKRPDFIEALMALGDLYTKRGLFDKGLCVDQKLLALKPRDPVVLYNLACSYSLTGDIENALASLRTAVECGYRDLDHIMNDGDLNNLRDDDRFFTFIEDLKSRRNP